MKQIKSIALITLTTLFLVIIPVISAAGIIMNDEFGKEETLIARISGNFVDPILLENIFFYREHVRISVPFNILKIKGETYLYAQLSGKEEGNYSIAVEGVSYYKDGKLVDDKIVKNFSITNNTADFSINPAVIIARESERFFIEFSNLKGNELVISVSNASKNTSSEESFFDILFGRSTKNNDNTLGAITLNPYETKRVWFIADEINESELQTLRFETENTFYEVPVYIIENTSTKERIRKMRFDPSEINVSVVNETTRIIYLENAGEESLYNISLSVSGTLKQHINLSVSEIEELKPGSLVKIELTIYSPEEEIGTIEGQITAKTNYTLSDSATGISEERELYAYAALIINYVEPFVQLNETGNGKNRVSSEDSKLLLSKTCEEHGGKICTSDEFCNGEEKTVKDGVCCMSGECLKIEGDSSKGKIIGWTIIIILIVFVAWFFKFKYKPAKREINLLKLGSRK